MDKKQQVNVWYVLLAMLALLLFQSWWIEQRQIETLPYSQFEKLLQEGGDAHSVGLAAGGDPPATPLAATTAISPARQG